LLVSRRFLATAGERELFESTLAGLLLGTGGAALRNTQYDDDDDDGDDDDDRRNNNP